MSHSDISTKLGCILLAAGGSTRLGQPKQLVEINGVSLVSRAAGNLLALGYGKVVVVTGFDERKILNKLQNISVEIIHNAEWREGMGTSLALAAAAIPDDFSGVLVLLADQWKVSSDDLERLVEKWLCDISIILGSKWGEIEKGDFGPPFIFPRDLFSELRTLKGDQGARSLVKKYRQRVSFVEMKNAAFDLDEPEDLRLLLAE